MDKIEKPTTRDLRFQLQGNAGSDATHQDPVYSYAVTQLRAGKHQGVGAAFTLGSGNDAVCQLAEELADGLKGREIEELMSTWGMVSRELADHGRLRWLGPHKGAVHLALASVTNACFDLWAKSRGVPLWRLLVDLSPEELVQLLDLSYVEDVLPAEKALTLLREARKSRLEREEVLVQGYPGYDTSVGWFGYDEATILRNARKAMDSGFGAVKLKVGSAELARDVARVEALRGAIGPKALLMVDANQSWNGAQALEACQAMASLDVYWIEEPTHPDDVLAHQSLARAVAPVRIAVGEHIPNRVLFKNFMQAGAVQVVQVDAMRVAGVSEFLTVSLLARCFDLPVVPHVGDMGQLHQHLVLVNHIALGLERQFLEVIPHLSERFLHPAVIEDGCYRTPQEPGSSFDFVD